MRPQSILLHGDTPGAVALGKRLRALVENAGLDGHAGFAAAQAIGPRT